MKVLLLTHIYPTTGYPTRGTYIGNIFRVISRMSETRVVCPVHWWKRLRGSTRQLNPPTDEFTGVPAIQPTVWTVPRIAPQWNGESMYYSLRKQLERLRRKFDFDIIVAAWAYPDGFAAARLARDFDCPLVIKTMGSDVLLMPKDPRLRGKISWGLKQAQRIIAVSEDLKKNVQNLGIPSDSVVVRHNGVNGDLFTIKNRVDLRRHLGLPEHRRFISYVGRLSSEKGVDLLLQAMAGFCASGPDDVDLLLVGSGVMQTEMESQVKQMGLEPRIRFCGERSHDEIADWISASDVFCLPSRSEGCPNVILEALASGRPVVATRVGGVPELLTDSNGIMVPSEDPDALAAGLMQALQRRWDPESIRRSVEYLSWDEVGAAYHSDLQAVLHEWKAVAADRSRHGLLMKGA